MQIKPGFGDVLKRNRLQQTAGADALGVSRISFHAWVHGRSIPTAEKRLELLAWLRHYDPEVRLVELPGGPALARVFADLLVAFRNVDDLVAALIDDPSAPPATASTQHAERVA